jgi:hypothetical protein
MISFAAQFAGLANSWRVARFHVAQKCGHQLTNLTGL